MSGVNWNTKDLADFYKRQGSPCPIADACGPGGRIKNKFGVNCSEAGKAARTVDGIIFDSAKEARDYQTVKIAEKAGIITELELQPRFLLQAGFRDADGKKHRDVFYVADFKFRRAGEPRIVVVDSKGFKTQAYRLKRKLFQAKYPEYKFEEWG